MVYCVCGNCDSINLSLSNDGKYLICNDCKGKEYIRDLDIGFGENNIKEKENKITELLLERFDSVYCDNCNSNNCDDCVRKSMGWGLSTHSAEEISKEILELIKD